MRINQNNLHYFKISQKNPEKLLDDFYIFDSKHKDLEKYIKNTKKIKNILITIKTLKDNKEGKKIIDKYFLELSKTLGKYSNCSEFACFINACDSILKTAKNNIKLLKKITERYLSKRILNEIVPEEWIQSILDTNSSRKKGQCGQKKLLHILGRYGFREVKNWNYFLSCKKCVAQFSKIFSLKNVRKNLKIKIATKKQNKKLDVIIKRGNKIFLCEAKHLNTSGGGQDKQISELIEITSLKENNKCVYYIAFLDGNYSNTLLGNEGRGEKIRTQRKEINKFLFKNPQNYLINTAGFNALIKDLR